MLLNRSSGVSTSSCAGRAACSGATRPMPLYISTNPSPKSCLITNCVLPSTSLTPTNVNFCKLLCKFTKIFFCFSAACALNMPSIMACFAIMALSIAAAIQPVACSASSNSLRIASYFSIPCLSAACFLIITLGSYIFPIVNLVL